MSSLLGAQTPESGGGGGWGPGLQGRRDWGPRFLALGRGSIGLGDCKKLPNPSWSKAAGWRGSGWGEGGGKVPGMGLGYEWIRAAGCEWIRAAREAWGEPGQLGAWEVEKWYPAVGKACCWSAGALGLRPESIRTK